MSKTAVVRQAIGLNAWFAACSCGWESGITAEEIQAEVFRDRHMAATHGQYASREEVHLKQQLAETRRERDVAVARAQAMAMGADPKNLLVPPQLVRDLETMKAEQRDLLTNMGEMARTIDSMAAEILELRKEEYAPVLVTAASTTGAGHAEAKKCEHGVVTALGPCVRCSVAWKEQQPSAVAALPEPDTSTAFLDEDLLCEDA